jgi:hypothetical protein
MAGPRRGMSIIRNMFNQAEFDSYPVARELTGIYLTLRGPNVGGGLPPMAASGPTRMLDWTEYISVAAVTASMGSAFTAAHF